MASGEPNTVARSNLASLDAQVTSATVNDFDGSDMRMSVSFADQAGDAISHIPVGEPFRINLLAEDAREGTNAAGVLSAFANVLFDTQLIDLSQIIPVFDDFHLGALDELAGVVTNLGGLKASVSGGPGPAAVAILEAVAVERGALSVELEPGGSIFAENQLLGWDGDQRGSTHYQGATVQIVMPGDANSDGAVDNVDITPFTAAISIGGNTNDPDSQEAFERASPSGCFVCADLNNDGRADNLDITPFIRRLTDSATQPARSGEFSFVVDVIASAAAMFRKSGHGRDLSALSVGARSVSSEDDFVASWLNRTTHST